MTSFADDNRKILKSTNAQYNRSRNAYAANAAPASRPVKKAHAAPVDASEAPEDSLSELIRRRKKYVARKKAAFAAKNRVRIYEAFVEGPKQVNYAYDEYTVREHNFPVSFAAVVFAFTVVAVFLLLNYSQISKYSYMINDLEDEMETYEAQRKEYEIQIDKKTDLASIEAYAEKNGMIAAEQVQSYYISMQDGFKIEKTKHPETGYTVNTVMSGVLKLFSEALGG